MIITIYFMCKEIIKIN